MATKTIRPPVRWHGGKAYLQKQIIALIPADWKRRHKVGEEHIFVEPYGGMASVLLNKPPCDVEVFNDIDLGVWNLFNVLKHQPDEFKRALAITPYHQAEFEGSLRSPPDAVGLDAAVAFYTRLRQSFGGQGKSFSYTKFRTRKGMADVVSGWLSSIEENLPLVVSRLTEIEYLENRDGLEVIQTFDSEKTFFYFDFPYLPETRTSTDVYAHEMSREDHKQLLATLAILNGRFILSGYPSRLYDEFATEHGWNVVDFNLANHAAGSHEKRRMTERLWKNY